MNKKLHGWDYIKSLMEECPRCHCKPSLGTDPISNKWQIACFNACCGNMENFTDENPFIAILKWNTKIGEGRYFDELKYLKLRYQVLGR